ncbi:site-specific integrase [uncultured Muribaculum sp.]|uniref:site-specific integrase n=1 Tax=uncultured Muribaculum sp. TaxID=1918613 RepID=UPI0025DD0734|nr:site-specific integrase [uncultured Muribaculum sp.]
MASIKVKLRQSSVAGKDGTVFYRIHHRRQTRQICADIHINNKEWDSSRSAIVIPAGCDSERAASLNAARESLHSDLARLRYVIDRLDDAGVAYSAGDVVERFRSPGAGVVSFTRKLVDDLRKVGKKNMARRYETSLNSFLRFTGNREVAWGDFDSTLTAGYEEYLRRRGLCRNSTSFYMRNLRSIVNRALERDCAVPGNPFKHVYTGIDKTVKRAVSLKTICIIRDMELGGSPHLEFARDVFMFAFYTRGMSFIDIAHLKKSDLADGVITYRRRKTNRPIQVRIEPETATTIKRLGACGSPYLLPIITDDSGSEEAQCRNAYFRINRNLKKIGEMLGLKTRLTLYVARHAWASIAHHNDVPVSTISKAMGHDSETTTLIYLSTIDSSAVDAANRKIMTLMKKG